MDHSVKTLAGNIYAGSISSEIRRRNVLDFWSGPAIRITPFKVEYTGHSLPGTGIKERNTWRIWRRENVDWTERRGTRGSGFGVRGTCLGSRLFMRKSWGNSHFRNEDSVNNKGSPKK